MKDKAFLVLLIVALAGFSLYQSIANGERIAENRDTLDSLHKQLTAIGEQVQEQEEYLSTVTDFIPADRIVIHGEGIK